MVVGRSGEATGVHRTGVDRVDGGTERGERGGEGAGGGGQGALLEAVGDLVRHTTAVVLAGGHHQDAAGRGVVAEGGAVPGVRLDQQDHRTGVDGPVDVEGAGVDRLERPVVAAAGVVGDQDVEPPAECRHRVREKPGGSVGVGQVGGSVGDQGAGRRQHLAYRVGDAFGVVGAPGLGRVVRHVVVEVDARAVRGESAGDGVADPVASAGTGDQGGAATQRQRIAGEAGGGGRGELRHVAHDRGRAPRRPRGFPVPGAACGPARQPRGGRAGRVRSAGRGRRGGRRRCRGESLPHPARGRRVSPPRPGDRVRPGAARTGRPQPGPGSG